ncbi:MAG: hypothetical protein H7329_10115 [Opitutaceae bacterium]|nr:hypothetical protein [Cytophagales bacterium]
MNDTFLEEFFKVLMNCLVHYDIRTEQPIEDFFCTNKNKNIHILKGIKNCLPFYADSFSFSAKKQ